MNILVTGANGQLGQCIRDIVEINFNGNRDHYVGEKNCYIFKSKDELNIADYDQVLKCVKEEFINVIINCAAYTNVNKAQEEQELAYLVNAECAKNLANAAKAVGAVLIHISTDYVFSAKNNANTPLPPVDLFEVNGYKIANHDENYYGYSKYEGEHNIIKSGCKYIIIRTSWLYSWFGKNFVKTMFNKICNGENVKVVYDQVGSPTSAHELAMFIYHIIENHNHKTRYLCNEGIYNFVENGVASWYDVVQSIRIALETQGFEIEPNLIKPCLTSEFGGQPVSRPNYSVLNNSKTKEVFNYDIKYWQDSLFKVVCHLYDEKLYEHCDKIEKIETAIKNIEKVLKK